MGLIKAALGAVGGVLADQWKEFFYCEALPADVIMTKGVKKIDSRRSTNKNASDNIITNGSVIAVADGQCMLIVEQGKVVELCAEPGEYTYDTSTEPSIFCGDLSDTIVDTFKTIGKRFAFGGDTGKDQRVYYINTKEIPGNKYGTANPVPFRVVDTNINLDVDIAIRCHGEYSYQVSDPIIFYTKVAGNVSDLYKREQIDSQLKSELLTALQPAFGKLSEMGIRYSALPAHTQEMADALNDILSKKWGELRGIKIVSFGVSSVTASEEDEQMIKDFQKSAVNRDRSMAAASLVSAQADAMRAAASNTATGPMMAFAGMNMAANAGGVNAAQLFAMDDQAKSAQAAPAGGWTCECGTVNNGKFCSNCGKPQPAPAGSWTCECGSVNSGKFCSNCGKPAPSADWTCECGTVNSGKFCSNCGKQRP